MKIRNFAGLIAGLIISASPAVGQVILFQTEFGTDSDFEGWTDFADKMKEFLYDGATFTGEEEVNGGAFRAKVAGGANNDAQMTNTVTAIESYLVKEMVVRLRQTQDDGATWDTAGSMSGLLAVLGGQVIGNQAGEITQVADETVPGDGWTLAIFHLENNITANITGIRIDPSGTTNESFEVDYIRVHQVDNPNLPPVAELDPAGAIDPKFVLDQEWHWDVDGDLDGWTTGNFTVNLPGDVAGSVVTGTATNGDAQMNSPFFTTGVPSSGEIIVEFGVETDVGGAGPLEMFWDDANGGFAAVRRVDLPPLPADGATHVIRVTFDDDIAGSLDRLRYDPSLTDGFISKIDYVRVYVDGTATSWDPDSGTAGVQGGTGTWDTSSDNWNDGSSNFAWPSSSSGNDDANFDVLAGTVTIDTGGVTANDVNFLIDGYTLAGDTLTLDGATSNLTTVAGTATISAPISRTGGAEADKLVVSGGGTIEMSGGATVERKWHIKSDLKLTGGAVSSTLGTDSPTSNGMVIFNDATLTIDGAAVTRTNGNGDDALYVGNPSNSGEFSGATRAGNLVVESGSLGVTAHRNISIAFGGSSGTMTVNGGDVTCAAMWVGWNGSGILNVNGGTVDVNGLLQHLDSGAGSQLNLATGGTLEVNSLRNESDGGDFTVTLNGGTLRAGNDGGDLIATGTKAIPVVVQLTAAGAVIDTNGNSKAIAVGLTDAPSETGTLTKQGAGTLTLGADCDYTGTTTVSAGTLVVNGDNFAAGGDVSVASGATIGGTGFIGGIITVDAGGTLAPGTSAGMLNADQDVILNGTLAVEIDGALVDLLEVQGDLDITNATLTVTELSPATESVYVIASYDTLTGTQFASVPAGWTVDYDYNSNSEIAIFPPAGGDYAAWIAGFPGVGGQTGFAEDPDGDGIGNGAESFLGGNPAVGGPGLAQVSSTGSSATFVHSESNEIPSDVSASYEWSIDLVNWYASGLDNGAGVTVTIAEDSRVDNSAPDNDQVTVTATVTVGSTGKLFVRLKAVQQ